MRIVCIGDIGVTDDVIHIGDEAMFDELVTQMRLRGVTEVVAISANPADTASRYGVTGIHRIGFPFGPDFGRADAEARMDLVLRAAAGESGLLPVDDPALAVIEAVRASDGVAIAGGGNLSSTWPTHIFERGTLGGIARVLGKPLVVSGQTLGPYLTAEDEVLVARLLGSAQLVGLRERPSYEYALRLGVPAALVNQTVDDASFLGDDGSASSTFTEPSTTPYCVVTMAAHIGDQERTGFDRQMAALLDHVAQSTGLEIVFFAHFGSTRAAVAHGDSIVHNRIKWLMHSPRVSTVTTTTSAAAARLARSASLSISSRYHPAVFAVSAGVPTIGITVDGYTATKLTGALGNYGQDGILAASDLTAGGGPAVVDRVWGARSAIRSRAEATVRSNRAGSAAWWDRVAGLWG